MPFPPRPIAFVLAACNHGTMIVNRNDYAMVDDTNAYGVGFQILDKSGFDEEEVGLALALLDCRRRHFGDGVVAIDGGANIGVHTIEWARHMWGWGKVTAFEAQEVVFYALAGNVALNNCLNARARLAALGENRGELAVPQPNYFLPASFGSLELRQRTGNEFIGQNISYEASASTIVQTVNLDSLEFDRLDFVKLDVEGMELEVLRGGRAALLRHHPIMLVEFIKSDRAALEAFAVELGYRVFSVGMNMLAVHAADPTLQQIEVTNDRLTLKL
jgi:FkbM family methyltransferase